MQNAKILHRSANALYVHMTDKILFPSRTQNFVLAQDLCHLREFDAQKE